MSEHFDPRIGRNVNGRRQYPAVDLNGNPYDRNGMSTLDLGGGFFVVLPRWGRRDEAALDALRQSLDPNAPPVEDAPGAPPAAPQKGK